MAAAKPKKQNPAKRRTRPAPKKPVKAELDYLEQMINGPGSPSDKINDVLAYLSDKSLTDAKLNFVRSICQQAETNTEKVQLLAAYFKTV